VSTLRRSRRSRDFFAGYAGRETRTHSKRGLGKAFLVRITPRFALRRLMHHLNARRM
jgi:hypothetical protein